MSSREYHECMSECHFTRGLVWMFATGIAAQSRNLVVVVLDGLMSAFHFYQFFKEGRRAQ